MSDNVRVRIAPSPTGEPHVGTAYIALMNLAYARKHNGKFILRIEDTDQARSSKESENNIFESLSWLGLNWDEGPDIGGEVGPYRQSERIHLYKEYIEKLLDEKKAYRCFCTAEDLSNMRKTQMQNKQDPGYFGRLSKCRNLTEQEIQDKLNADLPYVIRMAVPFEKEEGESISFMDEIRKQNISKKLSLIDDQVLIKSDGFPTYHFASIIDDHLMKISHVFRGEEWINSTFKHILLYQTFNWDPPKFFHLGLLRNPDANKSKISKRKNPVSLRWFRAAGYYPKALVNFLGLMGYSRYREDMTIEEKKNCEIFSLETMLNEFDTNKISSTGAAFDFVKLDDLNFHYVSQLSDNDYYQFLSDRLMYLKDYFGDNNYLFKTRFVRAEKEITRLSSFLFVTKLKYSLESFKGCKITDYKDTSIVLKKFKKLLSKQVEQIKSTEDIGNFIKNSLEELNITSKKIHMLLRIVVTGEKDSIPLYDAIQMLGLYRLMIRCEEAASFLNSIPV